MVTIAHEFARACQKAINWSSGERFAYHQEQKLVDRRPGYQRAYGLAA